MNIPKVNISEIFNSIQGEGNLTGFYTKFIRFQGCHIGCKWCDTKYSWNHKKGNLINCIDLYDEVIKDLKRGTWICITGGEPLEQYRSLIWLIDKFTRNNFYNISIETAGYPIVDPIQIIDLQYYNIFFSISPKLESALKKRFDENLFKDTVLLWYNNVQLKTLLQFKFVVSTENDIAFLDFISEELDLDLFDCNIYIQVEHSRVNDKNFIDMCLKFIRRHPSFRLGFQSHKFVGLK